MTAAPAAGADRMRRRFVVSGRVQRVGFRCTAAGLTRSLGVAGTVRNRPDGAVEVETAAAPAVFDRFHKKLSSEMPGRVDSVRAETIADARRDDAPDEFRIVP